jgi:hypothetical protein
VLSALYQIQDENAERKQTHCGEKIEETSALDALLERLAFLLVFRENFFRGAFGSGGIAETGWRILRRSHDCRRFGRRQYGNRFPLDRRNFAIEPRELFLHEGSLTLEIFEAIGHAARERKLFRSGNLAFRAQKRRILKDAPEIV